MKCVRSRGLGGADRCTMGAPKGGVWVAGGLLMLLCHVVASAVGLDVVVGLLDHVLRDWDWESVLWIAGADLHSPSDLRRLTPQPPSVTPQPPSVTPQPPSGIIQPLLRLPSPRAVCYFPIARRMPNVVCLFPPFLPLPAPSSPARTAAATANGRSRGRRRPS